MYSFKVFNLKCTAKRPDWPVSSVGTKPRNVSPNELPIASGTNLTTTDRELNVPHVGIHLPEDKTSCFRLCRVSVTDSSRRGFKLRGYHLDLTVSVSVFD